MGSAARRYAHYLIEEEPDMLTVEEQKRLIEISEEHQATAYWFTAGAVSQLLSNIYQIAYPVGENPQWRGPWGDVPALRSQLSLQDRDILARAQNNFEQLKGEIIDQRYHTNEEKAQGSFRYYIYKMMLDNPEIARPIFTHLATHDITDMDSHYMIAWQII